MSGRVRGSVLVLVAIGLVLAMTGTAMAATTWKRVSPPAKFIKYAKHAKKYGMQAWYPSRLPSGYKRSRMSFSTAQGRPVCDLEFKKGNKTITLSQGTTLSWAPEEDPEPTFGKVAWGPQKATVVNEWKRIIRWQGKSKAYAMLSGYRRVGGFGEYTIGSEVRGVAKNMRKVR